MTTTTATKSNKYEMTVNIPVVMDVKYCDVWPDTNGYGSQVSLKGTIDGEVKSIYLKGKTWANLKALASAGVIGAYDKEIEEPSEKVNVPIVNGSHVTLCRRQLAGEKYANLIVQTGKASNGAPPVATTAKVAPFSAKAAPAGMDLGGPIPGLDDTDDDLPPVDDAFEDATQRTDVSTDTAKLDNIFRLYGMCFDQAATIAKRHATLSPDVAAIAATMFIAATNRGVSV